MREVLFSLEDFQEFLLGLVLSEFSSESSGESGSQLLGEFVQRVRGLVGGVVLLDGLSALEGGLDGLSLLQVDDSEDSGDRLSDDSDFGNLGLGSGDDLLDSEGSQLFLVLLEDFAEFFESLVLKFEGEVFLVIGHDL